MGVVVSHCCRGARACVRDTLERNSFALFVMYVRVCADCCCYRRVGSEVTCTRTFLICAQLCGKNSILLFFFVAYIPKARTLLIVVADRARLSAWLRKLNVLRMRYGFLPLITDTYIYIPKHSWSPYNRVVRTDKRSLCSFAESSVTDDLPKSTQHMYFWNENN